jgi:hypothetical protein
MPGHEERLETCQELTNSLVSVIQSRVLHDIVLDRERSIGHDLVHSLKETLYVYRKLRRYSFFPFLTQILQIGGFCDYLHNQSPK